MQLHRRSLLFLALMLAIGGIASAFLMPVALFPNVAFPRVQLTLDAGDRPADQMAIEVTTPVEEAVRRVRGVRDVRSTTSRGSADIAITFDWGGESGVATIAGRNPGVEPTDGSNHVPGAGLQPALAYAVAQRAARLGGIPVAPDAERHQRRRPRRRARR